MNIAYMINAIEAILFIAADPVSPYDLKKIFSRLWQNEAPEQQEALLDLIPEAIEALQVRWQQVDSTSGFALLEVAGGYTFRSNPAYADVILVMREERSVRLSRAALETMAIAAYRQPITKPEIDHIRGVDCGAVLKLLLERHLLRIVGKKEEPGRPLLYGTTAEFLSMFNLDNLQQLPALHTFEEIDQDTQTLDIGLPSLQDLASQARALEFGDEPALLDLDQAVQALEQTELITREAFATEGVTLTPDQIN